MSNALLKDTLRTIRNHFSRYISMLLIIALGTAFFVGIKATAPDMYTTAEKYFTEYNLMDIRLQSSIGFTDEDIAALSTIDGIQYVSGVKFVDALVKVNGETENDIDGTQISTRAYSFSPDDISAFLAGTNDGNYINRYELISGKYPTAANECLVDASRLSTPESFTIGSVITLTNAGNENPSELNNCEFTIVGIIRCPYYLSFERGNTDIGSGKIGTYIVIPEENFTTDYYSESYIKIESSETFDPFSDEYFSYIEPYCETISQTSSQLIKNRVNKLKPELLQQIQTAEQDIQSRTETVNTSLTELDETIASLQELVDNGEALVAKAQAEFDSKFSTASSTLDTNKTQYKQALSEYQAKKEELDSKQEEYETNSANLESAKEAYNTLYSQYTEAQTKVDSISNSITTTQELISSAEAMMLQISDTQVEAYSNDQIQAVINIMQSTYPELYRSIKALTSQGLASEIISYLSPYLEQQKAKLAQQESEIEEKKAILANLKIQLEKKNTELQSATVQLASAKQALDTAQKELSAFYTQLQSAGFDITSNNVELEIAKMQAEAELNELKSQVSEAPSNLEKALAERENAQNEIDSALAYAKIQLNDAKTLYEKINEVTWNIYDRSDTPGYQSYGQSVKNIGTLANIFPIFFFIISSLVCLTTMTRLIEEDRTLIGTYEALGFSKIAVMGKYVSYSLSACILGSLAGIFTGVYLFPYVINSAYGIMYSLPELIYKFPVATILSGFLISLLCSTVATVFAIGKNMTLKPAVLMRPKAPKSGKRLLLERADIIWRKFSFTTKVTLRNLSRNKIRSLMTVIGIAGSCALLLASLGMYNSISDITEKQYGEDAISKYDFQIVFDDSQSSSDFNSAFRTAASDSRIESLSLIAMKSMSAYGEDTSDKIDVYVFVPENTSEFEKYIDLRDRLTEEKYTLDNSGAVITEGLANETGTVVGDSINFSGSDGKTYSVKVSHIAENYTFQYIYMSPAVYRSATAQDPDYSYAIGRISEAIKETEESNYNNIKGLLLTDLIKTEGITTVAFTTDTTKSVTEVTDALSLVIVVFFVSALILAFIVLYNLTNINIIERTRELATLKVLGFSDREVNSYIYRENSIVSFFGIATGIILGIILHRLLITYTAIDSVMYGQEIAIWSYFAAVAVTVFFIVAVNLILSKKLKNIDMVLSLKSVE